MYVLTNTHLPFFSQRTEELQSLLQMKFSKNGPKDGAVRLAFRFPDGKKLEHVFEEKDSTIVSSLNYSILLYHFFFNV